VTFLLPRDRPTVGKRFLVGVVLLLLFVVSSCHDGYSPYAVQPLLLGAGHGINTQEGTVTLRDGEETKVYFRQPFDSAPRVMVLRLNQSWFKDKPYSKNDFEIDRIESTYFRIRNNHHEPNSGAWAVVEWRAEGTRQPLESRNGRDQLIATVKKLGGQTTANYGSHEPTITGIDLHRTRATDADLTLIEGMTSLRSLNLYGTKITDAGMAHLKGLTGLRTLQLNSTSIGNSGLEHLQGLVNLDELGLYGTQVTDDGLSYLKKLTHLQKLMLGRTRITDRGLEYLKGLRSLKELSLERTSVTDAGLQELRRALPQVQIVR
jgi:Leucine rich repeat/Leucine Rich repeat